MKLQFFVGVLIISLATCSAPQAASTDSGIEGQAFIGPMGPVVQDGGECPDQTYQAELTVLSLKGEEIVQVKADINGRFKIPLEAGTYILHPESPNVMPFTSDQTVVVEAGKFTQVVVKYDSGIRNRTPTASPLLSSISQTIMPRWFIARRHMPVYTYRCSSCGTQFEKHQSFHDAPLKSCPKCKKKALKKVITPTKVIFKGSGFYATDNKSASGSRSSSSSKSHADDHDHSHAEDKTSKTSEKSSSEGKSEKKSKSKAESKSE